tara:strand:- start:1575 stop:2396 length:822 start_codon:yes stop_codon:yes gene_type:complete
MNKSPKKRGKLSLEEEKFIRDNYGILDIDSMSEHLNRSTAPIKRYIEENNIFANSEDAKDYETIRQKLHAKSFWNEIKKQFDESSGELEYFENTWINLIKQFREDVLPAEELQIKQFITIDILINRSMKERKRHIKETEKLQKRVDDEYSLPEDQRDIPRLTNLETQLSFARNSIANYTNEYTKLLNEQQKISKDLKATREQRIKRIEDGKSSWIGLIRMLEDEQIREREGKEMEILKHATEKSRQELAEYHEYEDGVVDRPFLTPEDVSNNE